MSRRTIQISTEEGREEFLTGGNRVNGRHSEDGVKVLGDRVDRKSAAAFDARAGYDFFSDVRRRFSNSRMKRPLGDRIRTSGANDERSSASTSSNNLHLYL